MPSEGHTRGEPHTVTMMICQAFEARDLRLPLTSMLIIKRRLLWENSLAVQARGAERKGTERGDGVREMKTCSSDRFEERVRKGPRERRYCVRGCMLHPRIKYGTV